ncbi:protein-tyrosine phosphatase family protein [Roseovarius sp.]|uniref:protein-tyrosine phosphatase family protein n=1 Tax=Roseovarius sp. TaxID=1486281 RepID=UPI003A98449F
MNDFIIYALRVGGGTLALAPLPGAGGDYAGDMAHIRDWKPALVVSLTMPTEMHEAGAQSLGSEVQEAGTRWIAFPIPDFGVPDYSQVEAWNKASQDIRRALAGGGRVLIHCRGGCGRSGMIALRLMIENGEAPDEALQRLRHIRPCAVETEAQLRWARRRIA